MTSEYKNKYGYGVAAASDEYRSDHESNGDACEDLATRYNLTEAEHQALWDSLYLELPNGLCLVVHWFNDEQEEVLQGV